MKKKTRKVTRSLPVEALPDWLGEEDLTLDPLEEEAELDIDELDQDDLATNLERGIRDLPVWKDLVARVGLKEARKILRQGMLINRITDGNPKN
ncbi:MAG: hypothetical protein ACLQSR_09910 [Limisphaerales bacterium]